MSEHRRGTTLGRLGTRWLGLGLASLIATVTIGLAATDRLALYINPAQSWFAVGMAVLALVGAVASFALPLGAEADHGHDHGAHSHDHASSGAAVSRDAAISPRDGRSAAIRRDPGEKPASQKTGRMLAAAASVAGGVVASVVAVAALVLPPASLSVELAMERDTGTPPLFAGADEVALAATVDTSDFGVGQWSAVFARATNPDVYDGQDIVLTGYVTPGDGGLNLGRLVITHCVIDAQPAAVPIVTDASYETGQWIELSGTVTAGDDGALAIAPDKITEISEPDDPYEY